MEHPTNLEAFSLGSWKVDPSVYTLEKDGEIHKVAPKSMAVLLSLARHAPLVRTKQELIDEVWNERFVTEGVLHNAVNELRRVLEDQARDPWAIETIHGAGYRLMVATESATEESQQGSDEAVEQKSSRGLKWATALLLILAIIASLAWMGFQRWAKPNDWVGRDAKDRKTHLMYLPARHAYDQDDGNAKTLLDRVLDRDPNHVHARYYLASLQDREDNSEHAEEELTKCDQAAEGKGEYYVTLCRKGRMRLEENWQEEKTLLETLLTKDPDNPDWPLSMGFIVQTHDGDCPSSIGYYEDAVEKAPRARAMYYLCDAQRLCGEPEKARADCQRAYETDPNGFSTLLVVGRYHLDLGDVEKARTLFEAAWALPGGKRQADIALGQLAIHEGSSIDKTKTLLKKARSGESDENSKEFALRLLGTLQLEQGRIDEAETTLGHMLKLSAHSLETTYFEGRLAAQTGDLERAHKVLREGKKKLYDKGSEWQAEWMDELEGWIALQEDRPNDAARAFRKALTRHPDERARIRTDLAKALIATGDLEAAREELQGLLSIHKNYAPAERLCETLGAPCVTADHLP